MNIIVSGGGTAGHINPAIAIADYAKENIAGANILYCGTPNGMEKTLVEKAGYKFYPIKVIGLSRSLSLNSIKSNIKAINLARIAKKSAKKILTEFKPDLVIGTGGYVCGPLLQKASEMGIKTAIHESNAYPGVTTKLLAKKVDFVFLSTADAIKHLNKNAKTHVVGNPLRSAIINNISKEDARKKLGLNNEFMIFSVGGSLGADSINRAAVDLIEWHKGKINDKDIYHRHGFGRLGKEKFPTMLKDRDIDLTKLKNVHCSEYVDNIDVYYSAADIIICRCGAMTISELAALGKAAILIPSPNVTENHQYHNGMTLVNKEAAFMIEEKNYNKDKLIKLVSSLATDIDKLNSLGSNAKSLCILDTTKQIFEIIINK